MFVILHLHADYRYVEFNHLHFNILQAMLTAEGELHACGTFRDANGSIGLTENGPEKTAIHIPCDKRIVKIASGADHVLALTEEGHLYSVGEWLKLCTSHKVVLLSG